MAFYKTIVEIEEDSQYWLKYLLAPTYGLRNLAEHGSFETQRNILSSILADKGQSRVAICTMCMTANLFRCPTRGLCSHKQNCKFHNTETKQYRPCPNRICEDFRDKICELHRYGRPSWKNTRAELWCTNHFEVAKCFMAEGYEDVTSFKNLDLNGTLDLVVNCTEYESYFPLLLTYPKEILTEKPSLKRKRDEYLSNDNPPVQIALLGNEAQSMSTHCDVIDETGACPYKDLSFSTTGQAKTKVI
ncbi:hypothetical protein MAR_030422, partial [Mya arenaria]